MKRLNSHARAEISIHYGELVDVVVFMNKFRRLKSLYLSQESLQAMYPYDDCSPQESMEDVYLYDSLPSAFDISVFETLTCLEFAPIDLQILPSILKCASQLEVLAIHQHLCATSAPFSLPETVPMCLAKHLRIVELNDFRELKQKFKLVKYMLKNGCVLERMKIARLFLRGKRSDARDISAAAHQKILMFPRCSKACKNVFGFHEKLVDHLEY